MPILNQQFFNPKTMHLHYLTIALSLLLPCLSTLSHAAGFAVTTQSASGMGNALAGAAVTTENPSNMWYNPASLSYMNKRALSVGMHYILSDLEYNDHGSLYRPEDPQFAGQALIGTGTIKQGQGIVPNIYYAHPINNQLTFGLGINAPFGLVTEYDDTWVGRYHGTKSDLKTININPALSIKINPALSLGLGANIQYAQAELTQKIDSQLVCLNFLSQAGLTGNNALVASCVSASDGNGVIEGDNIAYGWNAGLIYEIDSHSKIGLAYRSGIKQELEGTGSFSLPQSLQGLLQLSGLDPVPFSKTDAVATANIPDFASLSLEILSSNHKTRYLFDLTWTQWSDFKTLSVDYDNPNQPDTNIPQLWSDSLRWSIGLSHQHSDTFLWRLGFAYDQQAVRSPDLRSVRTPDTDRIWYSIGFNKAINTKVSVDFAYSYLDLADAAIDNKDSSFGHYLRGEYSGDIHIVSAQLNWKF